MGQDRPINALLPGFAQVHVFNSTRIKPFIPVYMPIAMYLGVSAQNTPRSRVSACFHLPSTASTALHVLSKCQTRVRLSAVIHGDRLGFAMPGDRLMERRRHGASRHTLSGLQGRAP